MCRVRRTFGHSGGMLLGIFSVTTRASIDYSLLLHGMNTVLRAGHGRGRGGGCAGRAGAPEVVADAQAAGAGRPKGGPGRVAGGLRGLQK